MGSGAFAVFRRAMSCQYNLLFLFLCVFTALSVSTKECGFNLVGDSCILKLPKEFNKDDNTIEWTHSSSNLVIKRKSKKASLKKTGESCFTMEDDGSLKCLKLTLEDNGVYKYTVQDSNGVELIKAEKEINVYEKAPKLKVKVECLSDGNATLSCDPERKDLTVYWFKEKTPIQNAKNTQEKTLSLLSAQVQENKAYSCKANNPVSAEQSESIKVSCKGSGWGKLFGFDLWIMVSIIASGGALLLLLALVLIICACRSCRQRSKRQLDEEELRLAVLTPGHTGTNRSKQTARGQPAPPIPLEDPKPCAPPPHTPPQTQTQPKAQNRARPPPPPQDEDEENPPPLPRPRNKQHRNKRNEEPYRPME